MGFLGKIMGHISDKLRALMKRTGLKQRAFAKKLGYPDASGVQRYLDATRYKKDYFPPLFIDRLLNLIGSGDPPITRAEVIAFRKNYDLIDPTDEKHTDTLPIIEENEEPPTINWHEIGNYMSAALLKSTTFQVDEKQKSKERGVFFTFAPNKCMEPTIYKGDKLKCDRNAQNEPGDIVIGFFDNSDKPLLGRYFSRGFDGEIEIIDIVPDNPAWPTHRIDKRHPGRIHAGVLDRIVVHSLR